MSTEETPLATREQLLTCTKRRYMICQTRGGQRVRLQSLSDRERSEYEADYLYQDRTDAAAQERVKEGRRRLIVLCAVDAEGRRVFSDPDVAAMEEVDGAETSDIYDDAWQHCGFTRQRDRAAAVKNSEGSPANS